MAKRQTTGLPKTPPTRKSIPAGPEAANKKTDNSPIIVPDRQRAGGLTREHKSRAEREARIQKYITWGTGISLGLIVLIVLIAVVIDQFVIPNQAVASVNGTNVTVSTFEQRAKLERTFRIQQLVNLVQTYQNFGMDPNQAIQQDPGSTWYSDITIPDQLGQKVVDELVNDEIVRQEAKARGITVTAEEVQKRAQEFFGYDPEALNTTPTPTTEPTTTPTPFVSPTPSPTPTITPTPEATPESTPTVTPLPTIPPEPTLNATQQAEQYNTSKSDYYDTIRRESGLSEADLNAYFESQALREKLQDVIAAEQGITDVGPFVNVRHILVATEEEAQDVIAALQAGESFAALAKSVSTDTGSGAKGGELDWAPVTNYVKPFADAIKTAAIGEIVGPVKSEFGYHIIQVHAREDRPLEQSQLDNAKASAFQTWLEDKRTSLGDQVQVFSIWSNYVPNVPASPFTSGS